jgi:hypothetical protein
MKDVKKQLWDASKRREMKDASRMKNRRKGKLSGTR